MTDDRDDFATLIAAPQSAVPPPRFDEVASANAQPVQPIPAGRISAFLKRVESFNRGVGIRSSAVAFVVISGLMTGVLGGIMLARVVQVTEVSAASESVSEVAPPSNSSQQELSAEVVGAKEWRTARLENRIGKSRSRSSVRRAPRAYLVEVIRR